MSLRLTGLKNDWASMRASLQEKVKFIDQVQFKHKSEVKAYNEYQDYLEPDLLEGKLKQNIKDFGIKAHEANEPVQDLRQHKAWLMAQRDRQKELIEQQDLISKDLQSKLSTPEEERD